MNLQIKELVRQIDTSANDWLPLAQPLPQEVTAWAAQHGWAGDDAEGQRLLIRQALLNSVLRQITPPGFLPTALDVLCIEAPLSLRQALVQAAQSSQSSELNFWGDIYAVLIPQANRRRIGQFWTNEQVSEWLTTWLLRPKPSRLVDVGCGSGNFLLKSAQYLEQTGGTTQLTGYDISPIVCNLAQAVFHNRHWERPSVLPTLRVCDYFDMALPADTEAVICNPPYTRHHHIPPEVKDSLHTQFKMSLGVDVPRQATLAFYFLLKAIADMPMGARAAFIVPMEVLDARYGRTAKRVLCQHTALTALIQFSPKMNAFHKVDVGASILLFEKGYKPQNQVRHLTLDLLPMTEELLDCLNPACRENRTLPFGSLRIEPQDQLPTVPKWFSISTPSPAEAEWDKSGLVVPLKSLAKVVRGIATGANDFFVMPTEKVARLGLEPFVVRTLQRIREIQGLVLDEAHWQALSEDGKNVWLLYANGDADEHPALRAYLECGEAQDYHRRALVQTRKRWFAMERRDIPPILFTILTRGNPRFIWNEAGTRPLNMFSLVYPKAPIQEAGVTDLLWLLLNCRVSLSRLHSVSRTYGGNTLKVEPRELDELPVVNPLALSEDVKGELRCLIQDYKKHGETSLLMPQVNKLVEGVLQADRNGTHSAPKSVQLRLLETAP